MDKYEYKVRTDEIEGLIKDKKYKEAVEIADTIDWRNVRNSTTLCSISDLYKKCGRFEDSRDILLIAYQRNPGGRMILYSLCELSIKLGDVLNAIEYFKEFTQVAPRDTGRFVLKYKLYTAQEVGLDERIGILEDLQKYECKERWMYELAYLYHLQGYGEKCVEECNQIVLYFGEGKYVLKALELKLLHEPLTYEQDLIYQRLTDPKVTEVLVKDIDQSKLNAIDFQKELANNVAEVINRGETDKEIVSEEVTGNGTAESANVGDRTEILESVPAYGIASKEDLGDTRVLGSASSDTRVINSKEILEKTSEKEPAVSKTILPEKSYDEMRGIMPKSQKNTAILFPNYDDMVYTDTDGQIAFSVPEHSNIEKQITGQISINEVLVEWERMKNANEAKWREDMQRRVKEQADNLFKSFDESTKDSLLEKLEDEVTSGADVTLTSEEKTNISNEGLNVYSDEDMTEISIVDEGNEYDESYAGEPVSDESIASLPDEVPGVINPGGNQPVPKVSDIREIIIGDTLTSDEAEDAPSEEPVISSEPKEHSESEEEAAEERLDPSPEELYFDRASFSKDESEASVNLDESAATPYAEPDENDYLFAFAQAGEERDKEDLRIMEESSNSEKSDIDFAKDEHETEGDLEVEIHVTDEIEPEDDTEEAKEDITAYEETVLEEEAKTNVTDEDLSDGDEDEDLKSTEEKGEPYLKSRNEEEPYLEPESEEESYPELEGEEEPYPESEGEEEPYPELEGEEEPYEEEANEASKVRESGFTEEQEERFEAFIQTEAAREQLREALESISMESGRGNVIIGSEDVDGAVELAKGIIMELSDKEKITGKVAKIKASTLNAKDASETLSRLYDGALIIQDGNELREETLDAIRKVANDPNIRIFIILTATKRSKHKFIMNNADLLESFDVSIDIDALSNKELVNYAKGYAHSKDYTIDELGILALHTRIDERQTNEHCVTITEVREIIDEAISKSSKKSVKHFMDVLVGKRYDDNEMIVLREKDFTE